MKKLVLAIGMLIASFVAASAACPGPAVMHDFPGTSFNMTLGASATGDCKSQIDADTSSQIHTDLIAPVVAGTNRIGYVSDDPCSNAAIKAFLPITLLTASVKVIAPGVAAKKITICHIDLNNTAADSIAVFESTTGTTCATSPIAVYGAGTSVATAGNGYNFSANGGISLGNGKGTVGQTTVSNNDLCIAQSAATPLTGGITYAVQ
jgi:hypothetical protein